MTSFRYLLALLAACLLVGGCVINSTRPLPTGGTPSPWRAVVVYGMGVEGSWHAQRMGVQLDEYDLAKQTTSGNCTFYNRTDASIPAVPGPVRYVAFDVPAGSYTAHSGMSLLDPTPTAYIAPPGQIVYIGDFIYTRENRLEVRRHLQAFEQVRKAALPDLKGEVLLAGAQTVVRPRFFLCTP